MSGTITGREVLVYFTDRDGTNTYYDASVGFSRDWLIIEHTRPAGHAEILGTKLVVMVPRGRIRQVDIIDPAR